MRLFVVSEELLVSLEYTAHKWGSLQTGPAFDAMFQAAEDCRKVEVEPHTGKYTFEVVTWIRKGREYSHEHLTKATVAAAVVRADADRIAKRMIAIDVGAVMDDIFGKSRNGMES